MTGESALKYLNYSLIQSYKAFTMTAVTVVCWALAFAFAFFHKTSGILTDLGGVIAMSLTLRHLFFKYPMKLIYRKLFLYRKYIVFTM